MEILKFVKKLLCKDMPSAAQKAKSGETNKAIYSWFLTRDNNGDGWCLIQVGDNIIGREIFTTDHTEVFKTSAEKSLSDNEIIEIVKRATQWKVEPPIWKHKDYVIPPICAGDIPWENMPVFD